MEVFLMLGFLSWMGLSCLVGWVTAQKDRGFGLGFFVSLIFSPLIGLLVAIAVGASRTDPSSTSEAGLTAKAGSSGAAEDAWRRVQSSLDESEYADFLTAFVGSPESMHAARHKRQLESWRALEKSDTAGVEKFLGGDAFPALRNRVLAFVESEAGGSPELSALLSRFHAVEAEERRIAEEAAQKLEEERIQAEERNSDAARKAAAAEAANTRGFLIALGSVVAGLVVLAAAGFAVFEYFKAAKRAECRDLTQALAEKKTEFQQLNAPFRKRVSSMEEELASKKAKRETEVARVAAELRSQARSAVSVTFAKGSSYVAVKFVNNSEYCLIPFGRQIRFAFYKDNNYVDSEDEILLSSGCGAPPKSSAVYNVYSRLVGDFDRVDIERSEEFFDPNTFKPVDWVEIAKRKTPSPDQVRMVELETSISSEKARPSPLGSAEEVAEAEALLQKCLVELELFGDGFYFRPTNSSSK